MKLTVVKLFEALQLGKEAEKLDPLVQFINGIAEQVVKALQGRLTIRDNAYAEIRELTFKATGIAPWVATFTPAQRTVEGMLLLATQSSDGNTIASWSYVFQSSGAITVSIYPRVGISTQSITAKFAVLFQ
jgi:hypothetical protein